MAPKQLKFDPTVFAVSVLALLVSNVLLGVVGLAKGEPEMALTLQLLVDGAIALLFTMHRVTTHLFSRLRPAKLVPPAHAPQTDQRQHLAAA